MLLNLDVECVLYADKLLFTDQLLLFQLHIYIYIYAVIINNLGQLLLTLITMQAIER